jgi:2,4-didehydro-3-deoxy-L-rhamnonate hydrolase
MKLVRFGERGRERPGMIDAEGGIRDLSSIVSDLAGNCLSKATLKRIAAADTSTLPRVENVRLGAPVGSVSNFIAVGLNYADHAAEAGVATPAEPILFNKAPSCIVGPNDRVLIPRGSQKTDWEVELAVVIGEAASYVSEKDAPEVIAGYTICHDVSERAFQLERGGQWMKGKGCPTFGPLGPWLVTPDEVGDPRQLSMWLDVNGRRMQTGSTERMIFSVPFLVSYISMYMALEPGDVITTGTPPGVGMGKKPPQYLQPGDQVTLGIERLGSQSQIVGTS